MTRHRFTDERKREWEKEIQAIVEPVAKKFHLEIHSDWWKPHAGRGAYNVSPTKALPTQYNIKLRHNHDYPGVYDGLFQVKVTVEFGVYADEKDHDVILRTDFCWGVNDTHFSMPNDNLFETILEGVFHRMRRDAQKTIKTLDLMGA